MSDEEKNISNVVIVLFLVGMVLWGFSLLWTGEPERGSNTGRPIYDIKEQQQEYVVETDRIGGQFNAAEDSLGRAAGAVEEGQIRIEKITGGINQCQDLLGEAKGLAEENERIFAELRIPNEAGK